MALADARWVGVVGSGPRCDHAPIRRCGRGVQHARPRCVPRHGRAARSNVGAVPPREPADLSPSARRVPRYRARVDAVASLVVADEIWCNSAFQRDELIAGLDRLLASRPITGMSPNGRRSRPNCASSTPVSTFASGDLDRRARHVRSWCRTSGGTTTRMWVRSSERSGDSSSAGSILTSPSSVITKAAKLPSSIRCSTGLEIGWWRVGSSIGPITSRFSIVPTSSCRRPKARTSASPWWRRSRPGLAGAARCARLPGDHPGVPPRRLSLRRGGTREAARRGHRPQCGGGVCAGWARRGDGGPCVAGDRRADGSSTRRTPPAMSRAA